MHKNVLILTGQIASGKSTARRWFNVQGYTVLDADAIVHAAYNTPNSQIWNAVYALYGDAVLDNGMVSRLKIRGLINNSKDLVDLENAVTDLVKDELLAETKKLEAHDVIWEVPLYKDKWISGARVLSLIAPRHKQTEYFMSRGNNSEAALELIRSTQPSADYYEKISDFVIYNNGTIDELYEKLNNVKLNWQRKNNG